MLKKAYKEADAARRTAEEELAASLASYAEEKNSLLDDHAKELAKRDAMQAELLAASPEAPEWADGESSRAVALAERDAALKRAAELEKIKQGHLKF